MEVIGLGFPMQVLNDYWKDQAGIAYAHELIRVHRTGRLSNTRLYER